MQHLPFPHTLKHLEAARYAVMLADEQVANHYQPIVDLQAGTVEGMEVLARLIDGDRIISPGHFLPGMTLETLEKLPFVSLSAGLSTIAACAASHTQLTISFYVSPCVLLQDGFLGRLLRVLASTGTDPRQIMLEVLEDDEFFSVQTARPHLHELRECGLRIALDDVGTGYSSLVRMRDLPIQVIKLDQGFVRSLQHEPEHLQFVAAMQSLARGLRAELIVEGVETEVILEMLGVMGIGAAQGYAIARPMPEQALVPRLSVHESSPAGGDQAACWPRTVRTLGSSKPVAR